MNLRRMSISLVLCLGPAIVSAGQPDPSLNMYGRPQQLVDIGGRRLNLYCLGHGTLAQSSR